MKYAIAFIFFLVLGGCTFIGYQAGLNAAKPPLIQLDYQLQVYPDSIQVYEGERLVGTSRWIHQGIDSLILNDNDYDN